MTRRERVFTALRGGMADRLPFTCYLNLVPRGETERRLREEGLSLLLRRRVMSTVTPNVESERGEYWQDGKRVVRQTYRTPVGEVSETYRTGGGYGTSLRCEFPIKRPEDYEVVRFMVQDEVYTPAYEGFLADVDTMGEDGAVIGTLGYTPMMRMLVYLMGPERFAMDMRERPTDFFGLYEAIAERHREMHQIAADSPADVFIYGDNITSEMIGLERFQEYVIPRYNEFASILHERGKLIGVHMDGKMTHLAEAVAESDIDIVEAFAAFPDGDLPIGDARRAWSEKVIWTNFPSPVHLYAPEDIEEYTRGMLADIAPGDRFLVGITENVPDNVWQQSMSVISRVLKEEGALPLGGVGSR
ncbi:MAG: uroporphyrinogen decarboxylase family protein [Armatimonadota bacterium]